MRKKPCTIAVGTPRTVLSNVSRNTGTRSTNVSVDGNGSHGNQRTPSSFRQRETTGFKKTRVSDCDETISLNLMIKTCEVERRSVSHVEFCCSRLIMRRVLQFSQYIFFVAIRFIDLKKCQIVDILYVRVSVKVNWDKISIFIERKKSCIHT